MTKPKISATNLYMEEYKIKDVIEILGINKSRVQYYYDTGVIVPLRDSDGPGTNRYFSRRNLAEILLAMTLTKRGLSIKANAGILEYLREQDRELTEEDIKEGKLGPNDFFSLIEPGGAGFSGDVYLYIARYEKSLDEVGADVSFLRTYNDMIIEKIPFEKYTDILLVNLTKIKSDLEKKLK